MLDVLPETFSDVDLEKALVALVLKDGRAIERIGDLESDDLTDFTMSAVLAAALNAKSEGKPVSTVTILPQLRGMIALDGSTGLDVVSKLTVDGIEPRVDLNGKPLQQRGGFLQAVHVNSGFAGAKVLVLDNWLGVGKVRQ